MASFPRNRPPSGLFEPTSPAPIIVEIPDDDESFVGYARFFMSYIIEHVDAPYTLHQIQLLPAISRIAHAISEKNNPSVIAALIWCRAQLASHSSEEDRYGISTSRALACEIIAIEVVGYLNEHDTVQYFGYEIPTPTPVTHDATQEDDTEQSSLLNPTGSLRTNSGLSTPNNGEALGGEEDANAVVAAYAGLNTLEIAIVAEAKHFLSQKSVQRVVDGIWEGRVVFWENLNVAGRKRPQIYNKRKADPYSRLRVPKYQKAFEAFFLAMFLCLYYAVLIERNPDKITPTETVLLLFFVAFAVDEFTQWKDAGTLFYSSDIWSWLDMFVILIGLAFLACRIVGLLQDNDDIVDISFDILSLEALFLIPRVFSLLSLHPYFGVLIPCLKQMSKDFGKFMILVGILYFGFLSTFSILGRDHFTAWQMSALMLRVFFGGTAFGFDAMKQISPVLGPPLMLLFIILTNILLITSLISLLSNSLTTMMNNAREEYLFMYTTFVMGSVTSNRLTYFYPPLNLIPLIFLRPLRIVLTSTQVRRVRIMLLKFTHFPLVAAIIAYEGVAKSRSRTNKSAWGPSSFKQSASASIPGPRRSHDVAARLLGRMPSQSGNMLARSTSVGQSSNASEREARRMRDLIQELSIKVDTLLAAKQ